MPTELPVDTGGTDYGKKLWDKRKSKMEKDVSRQIDRELKKARN